MPKNQTDVVNAPQWVTKLDPRYTVVKNRHAEDAIGADWKERSVRTVLDIIQDDNTKDYIVIESDWPEYEPVKQALLARINDVPVTLQVQGLSVEIKHDPLLPNEHFQQKLYQQMYGVDPKGLTEWLTGDGAYKTIPHRQPANPDWTRIPEGACAAVFSGGKYDFYKWIGQQVFVYYGDTWSPTGFHNIADFYAHFEPIHWMRDPHAVQRCKLEPVHSFDERLLTPAQPTDLLDTYWNNMTLELKQIALRHVGAFPEFKEGSAQIDNPVKRSTDNLANLYPHYHKNVEHLRSVDVYRGIDLFGVTDHAQGHAIKKLLCAGERGDKNYEQDIKEARDTLNRKLQMLAEDDNGA